MDEAGDARGAVEEAAGGAGVNERVLLLLHCTRPQARVPQNQSTQLLVWEM